MNQPFRLARFDPGSPRATSGYSKFSQVGRAPSPCYRTLLQTRTEPAQSTASEKKHGERTLRPHLRGAAVHRSRAEGLELLGFSAPRSRAENVGLGCVGGARAIRKSSTAH